MGLVYFLNDIPSNVDLSSDYSFNFRVREVASF